MSATLSETKAFDRVDWTKLVTILYNIGETGNWFGTYKQTAYVRIVRQYASVGGHVINTIRFAEDKAMVANSQKGLRQLMDNLNKVTWVFGMKINMKKTKV